MLGNKDQESLDTKEIERYINGRLNEGDHEMVEAFGVLDKNGKGHISAAEIKRVMHSLGENLTL